MEEAAPPVFYICFLKCNRTVLCPIPKILNMLSFFLARSMYVCTCVFVHRHAAWHRCNLYSYSVIAQEIGTYIWQNTVNVNMYYLHVSFQTQLGYELVQSQTAKVCVSCGPGSWRGEHCCAAPPVSHCFFIEVYCVL